MKNDIFYISQLEKLAETIPAAAHRRGEPKRNNPILRTRVAACLVYKNEIMSFGINRLKSHPFQAKFSKNSKSIFLHAETDAIKNALKRMTVEEISKSTLYVCRIKYNSSGKRKQFIAGLAYPCDGCQKAIATFNIKKVCYTCDDGGYKYL